MKKICISFLLLTIIILSALGVSCGEKVCRTEYLRIHIRANSNSEADQAVKYKVKDAVVEFLTPVVSGCKTKAQAERAIKENLFAITQVADGVLNKEGFYYGSNAKINNEKFPTRVYSDLTLEGGFYDALIVELGSGEGDNWWCVVYPPLCFTGSGNYIYKSKIKEIIDYFYKKGN